MNTSFPYAFPRINFCPQAWLDADKALSLGLSLEGLKYSIGFIAKIHDNHQILNFSEARNEFLEFYRSQRYQSLYEFYKSISFNVTTVVSGAEFRQTVLPNTVSVDDEETHILGTVFLVEGTCFSIQLPPTRSTWNSPRIQATLIDKTRSLLESNQRGWSIAITMKRELFSPAMPLVYAAEHTRNKIVISVRNYVMLDRSEAPCKDKPTEPMVLCAMRCKNDHFGAQLGCRMFHFDSVETVGHPEKYCHSKELQLKHNLSTEFRFAGADTKLSTEVHNECINRCPRSCRRSIYQATLQDQRPMSSHGQDENYTMVAAYFQHGAFLEGGIVTMSDAKKYSVPDFISNVGGTLGVFVGGTMLTLAQIVLFFVDYCCQRKLLKA